MPVNELLSKPYLTDREVAAITGFGVQTLRNDRHNRRGIPYYKTAGGRSVRYKPQDVVSYMEGRRITFSEAANG
ncbi:MAG: helix-turn-helix domain-containing protein [Smithella sp.]|nr:helix-turn-helix domain-containing protein [Smithella sp.]